MDLLMWIQVSRLQGRNTLRTTLCGIRAKHLIVVTSVQKHSHERNIFWITYDSTRVSLHIDAASAPNRSPERNTLLITSANTQVRAVGRCSNRGQPTLSLTLYIYKSLLWLIDKYFFLNSGAVIFKIIF